jgi:hypothetical protein
MAMNPNFAGMQDRFRQMGDRMGGPMGSAVNRFGGALGGMFDNKGKGAPQDPAPMVPQATGGFHQPMNQQGRAQLLQAMMQRSRQGRQVGA